MPGRAFTSTVRPNIHGAKVMLCIWWDQLGVVSYELFKTGETITGDWYRTQLMRLSRELKEKRLQYQERHQKVILQHDNDRPHVARPVKTYLETLKWEILPHPPYFSISALMKKSKNGSIRLSPQKTHRFFEMVSDNRQKDGQK